MQEILVLMPETRQLHQETVQLILELRLEVMQAIPVLQPEKMLQIQVHLLEHLLLCR